MAKSINRHFQFVGSAKNVRSGQLWYPAADVYQTPDGWVVVGLNNRETDDELVTRQNFVGVIKAAYAAADTPFRADVAARIALKDGIDRGAKMALLR